MAIILVCAVLIASSCKNQGPESIDTETNEMDNKEQIVLESQNDEGNERFIDSIENYIIKEYLSERDLRTISKDQRKFQVYQIDLNNDGKKEIFINFMTSYFCGSGGCTVLLLDDEMELITEFTVTRTPIYVEEIMDNGWRLIMVQSEGKWRKLNYKDNSYPSNPSIVEITNDTPSKSADILFKENDENSKTYSF